MNRHWLLLILLLPVFSQARPAHLLETRLLPAEDIVVGQSVTLEVDVLVATWFTAAPRFGDWQLAGADVQFGGSQGRSIQRVRDGVRYSGLTFSYRIRPLHAGSFTLPAVPITLTAGQAEAPFTVQTRPRTFTVALPGPLANRGPTLVASTVESRQRLLTSSDSFRVGDVLVREIVTDAEGAVAETMPPPPWPSVPGLAGQPLPPGFTALTDGRGRWRGSRRTDRIRYLLSEPGPLTLPALAFEWWNTRQQRLEHQTLPSLTVTVAPAARAAPAFAIDAPRQGGLLRYVLLPALAVLVLLLIQAVIGVRYQRRSLAHRLTRYCQAVCHRWRQSDLAMYLRARAQLRRSPPTLTALYHLLYRRTGQRSVSATAPRAAFHASLHNGLQECFKPAGNRADGLRQLKRSANLLACRQRRSRRTPDTLASLNGRTKRQAQKSHPGRWQGPETDT